jgi:hypothetical protein
MSNTNDKPIYPADATIPDGVSNDPTPEVTEADHAQSNYETSLKGVALARAHLRQAQERALRASQAYEEQQSLKIEAEKRKLAEIRAELDLLRADLSGAEPEAERKTELPDPDLFNESWD